MGAFPLWLAPVQVSVLNITDNQADYAQNIAAKLEESGYRAHADLRNEKIGFKIRSTQLTRCPIWLLSAIKKSRTAMYCRENTTG